VQICVAQLVHLLRPRQVAQPMRPEVTHADPVGQGACHQLMRRARQQRLPAMPDRPQPRTAMDRGAGVVARIAQHGLTGVQRDTHAQIHALRPRVAPQRPLQIECARDCIRRSHEHADRTVTLALLLRKHPATRPHRLDEQVVAARHHARHHLAPLLPQQGRALDIGQQERHRPSRDNRHRVLVNSTHRNHDRLVHHPKPAPPRTSLHRPNGLFLVRARLRPLPARVSVYLCRRGLMVLVW
jgi:hypothetical protein